MICIRLVLMLALTAALTFALPAPVILTDNINSIDATDDLKNSIGLEKEVIIVKQKFKQLKTENCKVRPRFEDGEMKYQEICDYFIIEM